MLNNPQHFTTRAQSLRVEALGYRELSLYWQWRDKSSSERPYVMFPMRPHHFNSDNLEVSAYPLQEIFTFLREKCDIFVSIQFTLKGDAQELRYFAEVFENFSDNRLRCIYTITQCSDYDDAAHKALDKALTIAENATGYGS